MDTIPEHVVPPSLEQFAERNPGVDYDCKNGFIYLYHGTNCYRRWEINRLGQISPGRSNYSFFSTNPKTALKYARSSCLRDASAGNFNSLVCEPIVVKVRFNARTWIQVDFITANTQVSQDETDEVELNVAVLGPVPLVNITDVLYCNHGRGLGSSPTSTRTFEDGTLLTRIRNLRRKFERRPDAWLLKNLGEVVQSFETRLAGGEVPDLTEDDFLRRLRQIQLRA